MRKLLLLTTVAIHLATTSWCMVSDTFVLPEEIREEALHIYRFDEELTTYLDDLEILEENNLENRSKWMRENYDRIFYNDWSFAETEEEPSEHFLLDMVKYQETYTRDLIIYYELTPEILSIPVMENLTVYDDHPAINLLDYVALNRHNALYNERYLSLRLNADLFYYWLKSYGVKHSPGFSAMNKKRMTNYLASFQNKKKKADSYYKKQEAMGADVEQAKTWDEDGWIIKSKEESSGIRSEIFYTYTHDNKIQSIFNRRTWYKESPVDVDTSIYATYKDGLLHGTIIANGFNFGSLKWVGTGSDLRVVYNNGMPMKITSITDREHSKYKCRVYALDNGVVDWNNVKDLDKDGKEIPSRYEIKALLGVPITYYADERTKVKSMEDINIYKQKKVCGCIKEAKKYFDLLPADSPFAESLFYHEDIVEEVEREKVKQGKEKVDMTPKLRFYKLAPYRSDEEWCKKKGYW
jgi:hypothetical protein